MKSCLLIGLLFPALSFAESDYPPPISWPVLIDRVTYASPGTLHNLDIKLFPLRSTLDEAHKNELNRALTLALVKSPATTLDALSNIDLYSIREDNAFMRLFTTHAVCRLPQVRYYDKASMTHYYQQATRVLSASSHKNSQRCLHIMETAMNDLNVDDTHGRIAWGTEKYYVTAPGTQVPDNWPVLIEQVTRGDPGALKTLPENVFSFGLTLGGDPTSQLNHALRLALIKATPQTLDALSIIDHHQAGKQTALIQRFNTDSVCTLSVGFYYDKPSAFRYYHKATHVLKTSTHKNSQHCLGLMRKTMEEFGYKEQRGTMKWGTRFYPEPGTAVPDSWPIYIKQLTQAEPGAINALPDAVFITAPVLSYEQLVEFHIAASIALMKAPALTLEALTVIDAYSGDDPRIIQHFDTDTVCGIPAAMDHTKASVIRYYRQTKQGLEKTALQNTRRCLWMLNASMEEIMADAARSNSKWGTLTYPTP